jgi:hypothetical protein
MGNPYGITLDDASLRWAAAEGVSEAVIAAICLLDQKSVDEIVARLTTAELEQVIKIVGRSPRGYPPGAYDALKGKRNLAQPQPPTERLSPNVALRPGQPADTNSGTEPSRRTHARRFTASRVEAPQRSNDRSAATSVGRRKEARELIAPVYGWFTEGFDTRDLREAKALLDDLAAR